MSYIIGGVTMETPLILGAGVCKDPRHLIPYLHPDLPIGAVVAGSVTPEFRSGNEGVVQWPADWTTFLEARCGVNSHGMPNLGIEDFLERFTSVPLTRPGIVSIAAFSAVNYARCTLLAHDCEQVSAIELNWGCGNTGKIPDAYSYSDAHATLEALSALARCGRLTKPIWVKLSPYITTEERDQLANTHPEIDYGAVPVVQQGFAEAMVQLIAQYPLIKAVVFSNTLANCRILDATGKSVTTPFDGKAGLSGPILRNISIGLIRRSLEIVPPWYELDFIGCGGILTGDDVVDYFDAGASAIQCTSGPVWHPNGQRFFVNLVTESERFQSYLAAKA